jgi:hypothetical protein
MRVCGMVGRMKAQKYNFVPTLGIILAAVAAVIAKKILGPVTGIPEFLIFFFVFALVLSIALILRYRRVLTDRRAERSGGTNAPRP